jgi:Putative peptidoglycan binding domain
MNLGGVTGSRDGNFLGTSVQILMMTFIKRWSIAASVAFALALAAVPAHAQKKTSSHSSASRSKHTRHHYYRRRHSRRVHLPKGPTSERINQIQSALARGGYYQGDPTGKWDSNTIAAMRKFQTASGLDSTGEIDAPTLQKLGLGSSIAGVSAPKPELPKCCAAPSTSTSPQPASTTSRPAAVSAGLPAHPSTPPAGVAAPAPSASDTAAGSDPAPAQH